MFRVLIVPILVAAAAMAFVTNASAQSTEFSYQGNLVISGSPVTGNYDLEFALFDGTGGQVAGPLQRNGVTIANGSFSVKLDFGPVFTGASRLLEIRLREPGGGSYTTLSPRQAIASVPYAIKSLNADSAVTAATAANFTGALSGDVTGTQASTSVSRLQGKNVSATLPAGGQVLKFNSAANQWQPDTDLAGGAGGVTGTGTVNTVPVWNSATGLGNSLITQSGLGVQLPNGVQLAVGAQGNQMALGSPNGETGITFAGPSMPFRADLRFGPTNLNPNVSAIKLVTGPAGGPPSETNGIAISTNGSVAMGTSFPTSARLSVVGAGSTNGISGINTFVVGNQGYGVYGESNYLSGIAIYGRNPQGVAGFFEGRVEVTSVLSVDVLGGEGSAHLCWNFSHVIASCSSSLRYKTDLKPFGTGLSFVDKLRPVSYRWKTSGESDIGFGAEDVAKIDPRFVTYNAKGEVEGVKYEKLSVVLVNALKEQQSLIKQQQSQIAEVIAANAKLTKRLSGLEKRVRSIDHRRH